MHTHLQCQYESWENIIVTQEQIKDLWQSVPRADMFKGKEFFKNVKDSIEQEGMVFPLIVVKTDGRTLKQMYERHKVSMNPLPENIQDVDTIKVIWGGSNRYEAAKELQFETIDCVVIEGKRPAFNRAWELQRKQRAPFTSRFY